MFSGDVDVIVCDGFIGNVALKISEGVVEHITGLLKKALKSSLSAQAGYVLARKAFKDFRKKIDYAEYGGAPLLGVRGTAVIGHGSSNPNAIKNAIRVAAELCRSQSERNDRSRIRGSRASRQGITKHALRGGPRPSLPFTQIPRVKRSGHVYG